MEFSFEETVDILALFRCACLFEEGREVFVEVDGATFTVPVRQTVVVTQEDHQLDSLFHSPVLMLEDRLLWTLPLTVLVLTMNPCLALLLHLRVALRPY